MVRFYMNRNSSVGSIFQILSQLISGLRLDLDPDIVAAMDDDFDYDNCDNMLEEDFMALANKTPSE